MAAKRKRSKQSNSSSYNTKRTSKKKPKKKFYIERRYKNQVGKGLFDKIKKTFKKIGDKDSDLRREMKNNVISSLDNSLGY